MFVSVEEEPNEEPNLKQPKKPQPAKTVQTNLFELVKDKHFKT